MVKGPWTQAENEELVRMWMRGAPISAIAEKVGRSKVNVFSHIGFLRKKGVPLTARARRLPPTDLKALIALAKREMAQGGGQ